MTNDCRKLRVSKLGQVKHAAHLSPKARAVKLADKIANLRDVADSPPIRWSLSRRLTIVGALAQILAFAHEKTTAASRGDGGTFLMVAGLQVMHTGSGAKDAEPFCSSG